jgi:predicted RNase H-like nuclease
MTAGAVLGIDIGYSARKKTTGACLLAWTQNEATCTLLRVPTDAKSRSTSLKELLQDRKILAAALDAPIRGTLDEIGEYRIAEMMLTIGFQPLIGKPGQASSGNGRKLNQSASAVAQLLIEMKAFAAKPSHDAKICDMYPIVEAFPTTFLGVLLDKDGIPAHGPRSDAYFEHVLGPDCPRPKPPDSNRLEDLLARLLPGRPVMVRANGKVIDLSQVVHHEDRAAWVCAVTALCAVRRRYVAVGDRQNGYIVLPPRATSGTAGLQDWAWEILQKNRPAGIENAIIEENCT